MCATAKFNDSIDVSVQLGVDAKKSDQVVRGSVVLPAGTGKSVRVAVFATGDKAEQAKAAGADIVGMDDLAEQIKAGNMPFDIVIASPDTMRIVGTLGQILGPRGLMPNPKVGTVTPDVDCYVLSDHRVMQDYCQFIGHPEPYVDENPDSVWLYAVTFNIDNQQIEVVKAYERTPATA